MEFFSVEFFSALAAIVMIDLVLAGDNAIVIALAARNLPEHLRKRAVLWGAVGAVAVRSLMTLAVVWLLQIPGLLAVGGIALLWIAYKLLVADSHGDEENVAASATFVGAMKTIIIADAVMGVDNVLAVAGAAHGSYLLVVLGLLISIPIVVWGSTILLKFTERFPAIVYIGGAILAATGVKMTLSEPMLAAYVPASMFAKVLIYVAVVGAVLAFGWLNNRAKVMQAAERKNADVSREFTQQTQLNNSVGAVVMERVLVPVDGSENSLLALREAAQAFNRNASMEVVLLNVQPLFNSRVARHVSLKGREAFRAERSESALQEAKQLLARLGVPFKAFAAKGPRAETIAQFATEHSCTRIMIGTARKNSLTRLVQQSLTARLLEVAKVPVQVLVGTHASPFERFGIPVGVGAALAAVIAAD